MAATAAHLTCGVFHVESSKPAIVLTNGDSAEFHPAVRIAQTSEMSGHFLCTTRRALRPMRPQIDAADHILNLTARWKTARGGGTL